MLITVSKGLMGKVKLRQFELICLGLGLHNQKVSIGFACQDCVGGLEESKR